MKPFKLVKRFRIDKPGKFRLADIDPADTCGVDMEKDEAKALLAEGTRRLSDLQERLYAQDRWAVLAIFQAMDAAGKDGAIKHVMSGINPQGVQVFRVQGAEPAGARPRLHVAHHRQPAGARPHRHLQSLVLRGGAGGARASRDLCAAEAAAGARHQAHLEGALRGYRGVRALPRAQRHRDPEILPARLQEEQRKRFLERLDEPAKRWKFSMGDVAERKLWDDYMDAYQDMIRHTSPSRRPGT